MKKVKNEKALDTHVTGLYLDCVSLVVKTSDINKLQQDTENYPIIRDQIANLGCLLVCTFGYFVWLF